MADLTTSTDEKYWNSVAVYHLSAIAFIGFCTGGRITLQDKDYSHDSNGDVTDIRFPNQQYYDAVASVARRMMECSKN